MSPTTRSGIALFALLLAVGPLGAAPQKTPPPVPPAPPAHPAHPTPPEPPDVHVVEGDLDVEIDHHGPGFVTVVRGPRRFLGLGLLDLTPDLRAHYSGSKEAGVLVSSVEADSPAAKGGVLVGDVVTKADGQSVASASDISRAVRRKESGEKITLEVRREKGVKTLELTVAERKGEWKEIRMRGFGPGFPFGTPGWDEHLSARLEDALERMKEKLRQMEERLQDLEKRLKAK